MWPLTGGCHYAKKCDRFSQGCGQCPALNSSSQTDLSSAQFRRYKRVISEKQIRYVSPSNWMTAQAENSSMINDPISTIPNCLDTAHFSPTNKEIARSELSIPSQKNVILTGGVDLTDQIKGGDLLVKALHRLKCQIDTEQTVVLQFGRESISEIPFETRELGWVDFNQLPIVYSSADVMAVPSRYESFGQTAAESLACGTPVVAFDTSGLRDVVIDNKSGLLADSYNTVEFMQYMRTLLENNKMAESMGEHARNYAVQSWSFEVVADEFQSIYERVIN
jgi:glycosyltransferase involved in cell wall biosynthesis